MRTREMLRIAREEGRNAGESAASWALNFEDYEREEIQ